MSHPAETKNHKFVAIILAGAAFLLLALAFSSDGDRGNLAPVAWTFAVFLLVCSAVYTAVHAVGTLMRDHERWRRKLDSDT